MKSRFLAVAQQFFFTSSSYLNCNFSIRTLSVMASSASHSDKKRTRSDSSNPTNSVASQHTKKQPLAIRKLDYYHNNHQCFLQVYGTGFDTGDTVPTVMLFFDQRRFIFNAGEGIQRYCAAHRIKLSKIDQIFLTRICSETTGGLPGLLLTLAGIGESGMTAQICGPGEFQNLVNAIRSFVPNAATVYTHSFGDGQTSPSVSPTPIVLVEDELVKISSVILCPNSSDLNMEEVKKKNVSAVYICELPTVLGKFDPKRAIEKGVRPGAKYGKLQRGEAVKSDDGSITVYPEDVLGPSSPGPIMILVDCPNPAYVPALTSAPGIRAFYSGSGKIVNCVVHLGPSSLTSSAEYQDWMANFKDAYHLMAGRHGEDPGKPILKSSAHLLAKLNFICPDVFPISGLFTGHSDNLNTKQAEKGTGKVILAENLLKFNLKPIATLGLDSNLVPESFDLSLIKEEFSQDSEIMEARDYVSKVWNNKGTPDNEESEIIPECIKHANRREMEIVFLGTGSSQPSKYRNVSGIYLNLFERGGILLDCGEGTYAQLIRRFGTKGVDDVLLNLKCIWISHIHADHHSGLPRILSARRNLLSSSCNPILVIGPRQLKRFLDAYTIVEDLDVIFLDCSQTTNNAQVMAEKLQSCDTRTPADDDHIDDKNIVKHGTGNGHKKPGFHIQEGIDLAGRDVLNKALEALGLKCLNSVQVVHCLNAYGIVLESQPKRNDDNDTIPGWKLVYSGDTRPCDAITEVSAGATILIHEATFDDSMPIEAVMKNHSTTKEAIEVGKSAGVYRIILTHFSQRYPKIPVLSDNTYTRHTSIAFDMMSINLADLPFLPKLLPAFKMLFKDEVVVEDDTEMVA